MNKLSPKQTAWLIPFAYLLHLADEYFAGFTDWFSALFKSGLSLNNFIWINSFGFAITMVIVILYTLNKVNHFVIAALGTLFFANGIIHLAASLFTATYSPGTISGILFYLPLGYLIYKKIFPLMPEQQRNISIVVGIMIQIVVSFIAFNI